MTAGTAVATATLRWPATAANGIDRLTSSWRTYLADGLDVLTRNMSAVASCWSSLSEDAIVRVLRSPRICLGVRSLDPGLWAPPILAEWAGENEGGRIDEWTSLGDIWMGREPPTDVPGLIFDGRFWRGPHLDCGIAIDQSLDETLVHPAAGLRAPRRLSAPEERQTLASLNVAVAMIDSACPEAGAAVRAATSTLVLRADPQSPALVRSASSAAALGRTVLVLNGAASPEALAESLVHEAGHTLLSCGELAAPMLAGPAGCSREATSPWTGAALPAQAFLHACVIWSSLLAFWKRAASRGVAREHALARVAWIERGFEAPMLGRQLERLAPDLSASGRAILEELEGEGIS